MNTGVISARYAKALLKCVQESGRGAQVCAQVKSYLDNPDFAATAKMEPDLEKFLALLIKKGRMEYVKFIFHTFIKLYNQSAGICPATLTLSSPCEGVSEKIKAILDKATGYRTEVNTVIDPDVIGGFMIEIEDYIIDATVKHQIDEIRRQFIEKNRRIL